MHGEQSNSFNNNQPRSLQCQKLWSLVVSNIVQMLNIITITTMIETDHFQQRCPIASATQSMVHLFLCPSTIFSTEHNLLATCRSISLTSVNLSRISIGRFSITAQQHQPTTYASRIVEITVELELFAELINNTKSKST